MREIILTNGNTCLVDDGDYAQVSNYKWYRHPGGYAQANISMDGLETVYMHRFILEVVSKRSLIVDHIDGNGLNNQRSNLRLVTASQNVSHSKISKNNKLGLKGIYFHKARSKYRVRIKVSYRDIHLGYFDNLDEAIKARDAAALKYHGKFAVLNK